MQLSPCIELISLVRSEFKNSNIAQFSRVPLRVIQLVRGKTHTSMCNREGEKPGRYIVAGQRCISLAFFMKEG
jgi:hypothetical protein